VLCAVFVPQYLKLAQAGLFISLEFRHSFPPKRCYLKKIGYNILKSLQIQQEFKDTK
jgi:hypothetical protein